MHAVVAAVVAALATYFLTPLAIRLAGRLSFFDLPAGYKGHKQPTPYLGGTAIVAGLLTGVAAGGLHQHYVLVVVCVVAVWFMGTVDDKLNLPIVLRVGVEVAVGIVLALNGLGWQVFHIGAINDALTVLWVLGVMNAFNLMDNMDGSAATTAAASALGAAVIALLSNQRGPATLCLATAGACVGFLPRNLANPARIFMGDGGSLPLGLLVAAMAMTSVTQKYLGPKGVIIGALLVSLVIFDTTLVTISRSRGGRSLFTGGRDHTTHRLAQQLRTPRNVALTLAITQLVICGITILVAQAGEGWVLLAGGVAVVFGSAFIWQFESSPLLRVDRTPLDEQDLGAGVGSVPVLRGGAAARPVSVPVQGYHGG
jgi:UDP-GlcNAc:undecaprenyl-phosphate/decaprenyl-phosphate GlcNAc-1-phosphate transferase